jgi:deoxyribose-phosphate aldolase
MDAGVAFLKTGTGWAGGATVDMVKFLKEISRGKVGVKASGGIRTKEQAIALIDAGATRIGTSHGVAIAREKN